ncbi:MAG: helix-turn-helix domain-containing protein, partial [Planctomycetes bacterium]|nr:helix-turn-helix domain-containing protein [Planctomycetota bacterium]
MRSAGLTAPHFGRRTDLRPAEKFVVMAKLITLEEAAHILGISAAEVGEMRQRQELYGYRDGGNWKFKQSDVEQLAMDRSGMAPSPGGSGILPVDLEGGDNDLVVLSEFELGDSGPGSSTVIGGKNKPGSDLSLGSDLKLDSGIDLAGGDSDLKLAGNSGLNLAGDSGPLSAADTSDKSNVLG